jgi:hypothetical protein
MIRAGGQEENQLCFFTGKRIGSLVKPDWFVFQTINDPISYPTPAPLFILPGMPYQAGPAVAMGYFNWSHWHRWL